MMHFNRKTLHKKSKIFFEALGIENNFLYLDNEKVKLHESHKNLATDLTKDLQSPLNSFFVLSDNFFHSPAMAGNNNLKNSSI